MSTLEVVLNKSFLIENWHLLAILLFEILFFSKYFLSRQKIVCMCVYVGFFFSGKKKVFLFYFFYLGKIKQKKKKEKQKIKKN